MSKRQHVDHIWELVHEERQALVVDLATLSAPQWEADSLCDGWSVHDVAAHLVDNAMTTPRSLLIAMLKARMSLDVQNQRGAELYRGQTPQRTLERLNEVAARRTGPPLWLAKVESRLVEEISHGEDIRRPLGITHMYAPEAIRFAMDYLAVTPDAIGGAKTLARQRSFVATDISYSVGDGEPISGRGASIVAYLAGRRSPSLDLEGAVEPSAG